MLRVAADDTVRAGLAAGLDDIAREGARRMLAVALEAEVEAYLAAHGDERDEAGRRLVVRNGHARPRQVSTVAGVLEVRAPRVDDRRVDEASGQRRRFRSAILPPWCRRSPKVTEVLPLLYLHGLSSGDFVPALEEFFGSKAGLSASVITRLTTGWQDDAARRSSPELLDHLPQVDRHDSGHPGFTGSPRLLSRRGRGGRLGTGAPEPGVTTCSLTHHRRAPRRRASREPPRPRRRAAPAR